MATGARLIQILLPVYDNNGTPFGPDPYAITRRELTDTFRGLTAHLRAPARGVWKTNEGEEARDDIVIFEVMAEELDQGWWTAYRKKLEQRFQQDVVVIRATAVEIL